MKSQTNILVKKIAEPTDLDRCIAIRYQVFVEGQKVPLHEEVDGLDPLSDHYLILFNQLPVGTARVRYIDDFAKLSGWLF